MDNPVVLSMMVYLVLSQLVPKFIKQPIGIGPIDDMITLLHAQQSALVPATLVVGLSVLIATRLIESE